MYRINVKETDGQERSYSAFTGKGAADLFAGQIARASGHSFADHMMRAAAARQVEIATDHPGELTTYGLASFPGFPGSTVSVRLLDSRQADLTLTEREAELARLQDSLPRGFQSDEIAELDRVEPRLDAMREEIDQLRNGLGY